MAGYRTVQHYEYCDPNKIMHSIFHLCRVPRSLRRSQLVVSSFPFEKKRMKRSNPGPLSIHASSVIRTTSFCTYERKGCRVSSIEYLRLEGAYQRSTESTNQLNCRAQDLPRSSAASLVSFGRLGSTCWCSAAIRTFSCVCLSFFPSGEVLSQSGPPRTYTPSPWRRPLEQQPLASRNARALSGRSSLESSRSLTTRRGMLPVPPQAQARQRLRRPSRASPGL